MKKSGKRVFSLVLTLILAFALAVPAFATGVETVGENSITITNSPVYTKTDGTKVGADYSGYLLMTLVQSGENYAYTVNPKYTEILLTVINENNGEGADLTVADLTNHVPTPAENNAIVSWISDNVGEGELMNARDFTNAVYAEILDLNIAADKTAKDDNADGTVVLESVAHGYWLIADTTAEIPGATVDRTSTLVILDTTDITVTAKNKDMTITKDITNTTDPTNVSDHNIGDTVNYTIVATIDPNMAQYDPTTYTYIITDTLSEGVVYDLDPTVDGLEAFNPENEEQVKKMMGLTIKLDNDGDGTIEDGEGEDISKYFTVDLLSDTKLDDGFTFTITGKTSGDHIWASSEKRGNVIVNYNAIVNKFAVIGGEGNPNEVDLEFSNNPDTNSTGETPKDIVTSFTYQLNVTKVDGKDESVTLKDARFALYRLVDDTKKEYVLIDANNKVSGWQDDLPTVTETIEGEEVTLNGNIVTNDDGRMSVIGLDAGTYYLTECVAPDGYNLLDKDVKITIDAEYSPDGKTITKLTVTVDDAVTSNNGNIASGELEVIVKNFSGAELPSTGGIGTTIFYTLGGLLAVGAAVFLVTKKRMSGVEE